MTKEWVSVIAVLTAFVLAFILYKIFIPILRKVKLGQKILEIGPSWHKCKEGTPNLGGLFFTFACVIAVIIGVLISDAFHGFDIGVQKLLLAFGLALGSGIIGFIDDYIKLFKKRNKGLSALQKLILQFIVVGLYLYFDRAFFDADTAIDFPWGGKLELGVFYYVIMLLVITYIINCANLTDGIDGLAGSISLIICFMFILLGLNTDNALYYIPSSSLFGALLAFLVFNFHPAKIFMGDTGSLFLGGFVVGMVMLTGSEFMLIPVSVVWILEGLSVVLQVLSFKLTGKRIFKMSPIHHHFEKCGWSEVKIVMVFSLVTAAFCGLSYWLITLI